MNQMNQTIRLRQPSGSSGSSGDKKKHYRPQETHELLGSFAFVYVRFASVFSVNFDG